MPLHAQSFGAGPDVVFLHGFLGSGDNFWPQAQALQDRYRCWLLDLPGHGRSGHLPSYSISSLAQGVREGFDALGLQTLRLVGHSLGGKVAARLAQLEPKRVERLLMADITPTPTPARHGAILRAMRDLPLESLQRREEAEPYLREAEPVLDVRRFLLKNLEKKSEGGWAWKPDIVGFERDEKAMLEEKFDGSIYSGKTLLVCGARSEYVTDEDVVLTRKQFPNLEVKTLDAGHWLHAEKPAEFLDVLEGYLGG